MNSNPITHRDCAAIGPLLPRLPDGDISLAEQAALETHLGKCAPCREEAGAFAAIGIQLRECAPSPGRLPSGPAMAARIQELERPRFDLCAFLPRAAWAGLAATSLAAFLLAAGLQRFGAVSREGPHAVTPERAVPAPVLFLVDDEASGRRVVVSMGRGGRP